MGLVALLAERPQHVITYDDHRKAREGKSIEEQADPYDEYEMEPLLFLSSIGQCATTSWSS